MVFNVATWILSTVLITFPHVLSYKGDLSNKGPCCFLTVTPFSMLIIIFLIILITVAINLWTYVLTLIVIFKTDVNDWSEVNNRTVTNNSKKAQTQIEITSQNYTPSTLVNEVLETAFQNNVTNTIASNGINDKADSESNTSDNSENSYFSDYSGTVNINKRIETVGTEYGMNNIEMPNPQHLSNINVDNHEENIDNYLNEECPTFIDSAANTKKESFQHSLPEDIQKDGKPESVDINIGDNRSKTDSHNLNKTSAAKVENNESLVQLQPVTLVCLLNFCFIITWTPYLTILFVYISVCNFEGNVQICKGLEANLFPVVITIGIIDWMLNPVIYFYIRRSI